MTKSWKRKLNSNNSEDRVVQWYEHFRKLLGNSPEVTNENEEIHAVFENLHIKYDIFTLDEYKRVKISIKFEKSVGEDGIMTEVLKCVPIDEIVLDIINKSYINSEHCSLNILTYVTFLT